VFVVRVTTEASYFVLDGGLDLPMQTETSLEIWCWTQVRLADLYAAVTYYSFKFSLLLAGIHKSFNLLLL